MNRDRQTVDVLSDTNQGFEQLRDLLFKSELTLLNTSYLGDIVKTVAGVSANSFNEQGIADLTSGKKLLLISNRLRTGIVMTCQRDERSGLSSITTLFGDEKGHYSTSKADSSIIFYGRECQFRWGFADNPLLK